MVGKWNFKLRTILLAKLEALASQPFPFLFEDFRQGVILPSPNHLTYMKKPNQNRVKMFIRCLNMLHFRLFFQLLKFSFCTCAFMCFRPKRQKTMNPFIWLNMITQVKDHDVFMASLAFLNQTPFNLSLIGNTLREVHTKRFRQRRNGLILQW